MSTPENSERIPLCNRELLQETKIHSQPKVSLQHKNTHTQNSHSHLELFLEPEHVFLTKDYFLKEPSSHSRHKRYEKDKEENSLDHLGLVRLGCQR